MTEAKRKAEELYAKFLEIDESIGISAVEMSLLCVEEIMKSYPFGYSLDNKNHWKGSDTISFLKEVKNELNKMI